MVHVEGGNAPGVLLLRLSFEQLDVGLLNEVRALVANLVDKRSGGSVSEDLLSDVLSDVTMATHELLENALKYADPPGTEAKLEVRLAPAPSPDHAPQVQVQTENTATPEHAARVQAIVDRLQKDSATAVYLELLELTAEQTDGSGLGIARLAAECSMLLSTSYHGGRLAILASTTRKSVS